MKKQYFQFKKYWLKITEPSASISDPVDRQTARLFITLLLLVLPPGVIASLLLPITTGDTILSLDRNGRFVFYSLGVWILVYFFARSKFYKLGIRLAFGVGITLILLAALTDYDIEDFTYFLFVLMAGSLFFSQKQILIITIIGLGGVLSNIFLYPEANLWESSIYPAVIIMIGGLLSNIGVQHLKDVNALTVEKELRNEKKVRDLLRKTYDGLAEINNDTFVQIDHSFATLFGYSPNDLIGKPVSLLLDLQRSDDGERHFFDTLGKTSTSKTIHLEVVRETSSHESSTQLIAVRDITSRKVEEAELKRQAHIDTVTGLNNRTQLLKHLTFRKQNPHPKLHTSLLFLDLDNFKSVNDQFGHDAGDEILRMVGQRLEQVIREEDIVARYGGDEFVLVCDYPVDDTYTIANRILMVFHVPFLLREVSIHLTPSIGIVRDINTYKDADDVLRAADQAMYRAKNRGKNQFDFAFPENATR